MAMFSGGATRRAVLAGSAASALLGARAIPAARAQGKFPSRRFSVIIPTGQGGGAERLARAFDTIWSKALGQPFEYEFHPGASGQVGYTLYVQKRERDGHNLLFGNMGPEMIMYALQKPAYKFPEDYIYFCRTDIDDSCIFVKADSPFKRVEDVVAEAKKRTLNVATSRIPHPASIGMLALGKETNSKYNLIPFGGGNPTQIAVLSGEVDIGVLPAAGIVRLADKLRILGIFNTKDNVLAKYTNNAPLINAGVRHQAAGSLFVALVGGSCRICAEESRCHEALGRQLEESVRQLGLPRCGAKGGRSARSRSSSATRKPAPNMRLRWLNSPRNTHRSFRPRNSQAGSGAGDEHWNVTPKRPCLAKARCALASPQS